ncbi:cellulase family glycosylhydrolase [Polaribacter sp. L3A8]|uniref:cellulase family glycosylhydrolase n=1 Tax=Polaribacter sp. L3A8 TaxID=2686361 RepID=UPI00131B0996|nr:cellulase family glycosylhydrolase [Polaribacter sp. L3A8]
MKNILSLLLFLLLLTTSNAQIKHGLRDESGRHVIPRGFVIVTNAGDFKNEDFVRMVRMGANYQVVRLELGKLSNFPGAKFEQSYLDQLERLVEFGKKVGIKTVFKMTVYGVKKFSWEAFWANKNNEHEIYMNAWKKVWHHFKNEDYVVGYDVVNEPRKLTMNISYKDLTNDYLIPVYQKIIDESQKINSNKKILIQSIFMNKGEGVDNNQYAEITASVNRKNIVFSPHIYQNKQDLVQPVMSRFDKEAIMLKAPILIGEWGFPTFAKTDTTLVGNLGQYKYRELYIKTAEVFDQMGVGSIKAWFSGNPSMQNFMPGGPSTWAIFSDKNAVGTSERKYITDIIARPYPQTIAGTINSFLFNFATRTLNVNVKTDNSKGASQIFIGANRHYPDGFSIMCGPDVVLVYNPLKNVGLELVKGLNKTNISNFIWNEKYQQLTILKWPKDNEQLNLKIVPGIYKQ